MCLYIEGLTGVNPVIRGRVWNNFSIKTDPATPLKLSQGSGFTVQRLKVHSSQSKFIKSLFSHPVTLRILLLLLLPLYFSFSLILWLGYICCQNLSDGRGPAVGVFAVVFSERAALEELPLGVEQPAHATARFGAGVAWLTRVQRVHWHLGGSRPCVATFPKR